MRMESVCAYFLREAVGGCFKLTGNSGNFAFGFDKNNHSANFS